MFSLGIYLLRVKYVQNYYQKPRGTSLTLFWCLYFELGTYFTHCSGVCLVDFEQGTASWVMNLSH